MNISFQFPAKLKTFSFAAIGLGLVLGIASFFIYSDSLSRVWASFLINNVFFLLLGLFGTVIIGINYLATSGWMTVEKRIAEAMGQYVFVGLLGMLVIGVFGMQYIYEWSHTEIVAHDTILQAKEWFLNKPMYFILIAIGLISWVGFTMWLRKVSLDEDRNGGTSYYFKSYKISAAHMVIFGFSFCAAIFIWLMSIDPHWYSTIYAVYVFASIMVIGFTFLNIAGIYLNGKGFLPWFNDNHMHDNSKFMFGFSIFWGYIFISQLLLIWYANIPEETPYYLIRWGRLEGEASYKWLWYANIILNFAAPFLIFMTRGAKRVKNIVMIVCFVILAAKWIDIYLLITPGVIKFANHFNHLNGIDHHLHPGFGLPEISFFLFFAGLFIFVVGTSLSKANIVPTNHPYLEESVSHHV